MEKNIVYLKQNNRLLNIIRCNPGISKSTLSEILNVSWPTISNAIETLKASDILSRDSTIQINPDHAHMIGISVDAAQIKLCIIDMNFEVIASGRFKEIIGSLHIFKTAAGFMFENHITPDSFVCFKTSDNLFDLQGQLDAIMQDIITLVENQERFHLNIVAAGLTFTGAVDNTNKKIVKSHNLDFISDKPLGSIIFPNRIDYFEQKNIHIYADNNSNPSVVAEKYNLYNAACSNYKYRDKKNIISIYLGTGIGSGMIFNNRQYHGASNFVGELGHIEVPLYPTPAARSASAGQACSCGNNNCLDFRIRHDVFEMNLTDFSAMSTDDIAAFLCEHPEKTDVLSYYIGYIVNLLINILNPDMIIFTGKFSSFMDKMWLPLYSRLNSNKLSYIRNECTLIASNLGIKSPSIGAAICSYFDKIKEPVEW